MSCSLMHANHSPLCAFRSVIETALEISALGSSQRRINEHLVATQWRLGGVRE